MSCAVSAVQKVERREWIRTNEHVGHFMVNLGGEIAGTDAIDVRAVGAASVEMFGCFDFVIDGRSVPWQRRRDREIVAFLAVAPEGRATRAHLISVFWPNADRQLAAQSLRTACSTIRRAFAARVGLANVARYFVAGALVELKLDVVRSSVIRFVSHIVHADRAYEAGAIRLAYMHYTAGERLYTAPFLAGEAPAGWSVPHVARLAAMQRRAAERIDALSQRVTSGDVAGMCSILDWQKRSA